MSSGQKKIAGQGTEATASTSTSYPRSIPTNTRPASQMSTLDKAGPYSVSAHSTGTVRRLSDAEGGTEPIPSSLESFNTAHEVSTSERDPPHLSRTSSQSSIRDRVASPERRPPRPPTARRTSSATHLHKRKGFSADDETSEIEEDWEHQRATAASVHGSTGYSTMRKRRSQLLRRRGTQTARSTVEESVDEEPPSSAEADDENEHEHEEGTVRADSYEPSEAGSVESFTLKDRQQAINETHPFGIRIWKPALYKKSRSVQRTAEGDIHSAPGGSVGPILLSVNILWVLLFGWWMAAITAILGFTCYIFFFSGSNRQYGKVLLGLSYYLLYPFGRFVELKQEDAYADEDEGEGRSISEYEQWQAGDIEAGRTFFGPQTSRTIIGRRRDSLDTVSETESLLGTDERTGLISRTRYSPERKKRRLFGRGQWSFGRVLFYACFYTVIAPMLLVVSGICWLLVFWIPMAKVSYLLFDHLRRHPLALSFHSDNTWSRRPGTPSSSILLCTYRAVGWKYYKYTVDGTNIFFINLMMVVIFVIVDHFVLHKVLGDNPVTSPATIFTLALFSVIPLAYFIGQAVASISAQSSMGVGATINAFFSTLVEVYLYCIALTEGKGRLVEGSIVGSIFAGVVFMPGLSMCSGALKRKTQRFNAKSAGVTSTMLLFAVIAAFAPTLFYQIYGTYELSCHACTLETPNDTNCRKCFFSQTPPTGNDKFFKAAIQPYTYVSAVFLFISYIVGLWFTLRTHAAVIWQVSPSHIQPNHSGLGGSEAARGLSRNQDSATAAYDSRTAASLRESQLYKRILGQSLKNIGLRQDVGSSYASNATPHVIPLQPGSPELPNTSAVFSRQQDGGLSDMTSAENAHIVRGVAEVAAAAATAAVQDAQRCSTRKNSITARGIAPAAPVVEDDGAAPDGDAHGGHDAPNWSKVKSSVILLGATVLYAIIAEILVTTVDVVLENFDIDEKFLGITLFALVPNTTEFLNAISFAMNGNIALSMEIGSAYALQVCLLQIPALVAFSAFYGATLATDQLEGHTFSLIFPQWDLVTVILCVFLLSHMYGEGKSNYFKGSILILSYLTVMLGFYFASFAQNITDEVQGVMLGVGQKGTSYYIKHT
ncbi:Sodium/calcium exchanger protein-domain-containing protein [Geopyxis carbonaria]|nr:Sodium/calcium exchanger protein-domain-containing protein [Geopyxis carbonaria]